MNPAVDASDTDARTSAAGTPTGQCLHEVAFVAGLPGHEIPYQVKLLSRRGMAQKRTLAHRRGADVVIVLGENALQVSSGRLATGDNAPPRPPARSLPGAPNTRPAHTGSRRTGSSLPSYPRLAGRTLRPSRKAAPLAWHPRPTDLGRRGEPGHLGSGQAAEGDQPRRRLREAPARPKGPSAGQR
jgi:hypothetical protein